MHHNFGGHFGVLEGASYLRVITVLTKTLEVVLVLVKLPLPESVQMMLGLGMPSTVHVKLTSLSKRALVL